MKRRRMFLLLGAMVLVAVGLALHDRAGKAAVPGFVDLETALASERAEGWTVAIPPKLTGPYRRHPGSPVLGRSPADGLQCRLRDKSGAVTEEIVLQGSPDRDQRVVYLDTADGRQTMAALERVRP